MAIPLFASKLAQKAFSYLMTKAKLPPRDAMQMVIGKADSDSALLKLMKEYGYKPTKVDVPKQKSKGTTMDKPLGPGGKKE